jgi:hypothetical protein
MSSPHLEATDFVIPPSSLNLPSPTPQLTPISKSKRAQARFANALAELSAPCFFLSGSSLSNGSAQGPAPVFISDSAPNPSPPIIPTSDAPGTSTSTPLPKRMWAPPIRIVDAQLALNDLLSMLHPKRIRKRNGIRGRSAKAFACDAFSRRRFIAMEMHLRIYSHQRPSERLSWMASSIKVASNFGRSSKLARNVRKWCRDYVVHRILPPNLYGKWTTSMLDNGDLAREIFEHLTSVGAQVQAYHVVEYLANPDVQQKYGLKGGISLSTANRWMSTMGYRWGKTPKGKA